MGHDLSDVAGGGSPFAFEILHLGTACQALRQYLIHVANQLRHASVVVVRTIKFAQVTAPRPSMAVITGRGCQVWPRPEKGRSSLSACLTVHAACSTINNGRASIRRRRSSRRKGLSWFIFRPHIQFRASLAGYRYPIAHSKAMIRDGLGYQRAGSASPACEETEP